MKFTLQDLQNTIENNKEIFTKAIINNIKENGDFSLKSQEGSIMTLTCDWGEEPDKVINLDDINEILELGYENIITLIKKLNVITPLSKITSKEDICDRMIEFAKDVVSNQIDSKDYEVRLTDGDGGEDSYYIVCFLKKEDYLRNKSYINAEKIRFKVYSDIGVIFELNRWSKGYLNLNGSYFYKDIGTDEELLRGLFLSHYYFANVKFED